MSKPQRDANFKKGFETSESRRRREGSLINLRRNRRETMMAKRRNEAVGEITEQPQFGDISNFDTAAGLADLVKGIQNTNIDAAYNHLVDLHNNPPVKEMIELGAIPHLVNLLKLSERQRVQYESSWILTNVASGDTSNVELIVSLDAVPPLIDMMDSPCLEVSEQACWTLGNIAGDGPKYRDVVLSNRGMDALTRLMMRTKRETVMRTLAWTLSNFCRGKPSPPFEEMKKCLPFLTQLLAGKDAEVATEAAWGLAFISDDDTKDNEKIQAVTETGCVKTVAALLHFENKIVRPLLRILGNVATGNEFQTQLMLDNYGLEILNGILESPSRRLHKEVMWTLSNIAAGTFMQAVQLVHCGVIQSFPTQSFEVKKETAWVLANLCSKNDKDIIKNVVDLGGLKVLAEILSWVDVESVLVALEGCSAIFQCGARAEGPNHYTELFEQIGGLDKLEQTQEHDNDEIYQKSLAVLTMYFAEDDQPMDELKPQEAGDTFKFGGAGDFTGSFGSGF